ncbi:IS5 family transposase [Parasutterella excrementihominis]
MKIKAPSFAALFAETSPQLGGAGRTKFLETLERIIPWQDLESLIGPYYSEGKRGVQPYPLELMIRIHFLQLVYNLSDPMCEETLHDSFACRRFVGLTMDSECPDETTILRFRHLLEKNGLDKQVFELFKQQLSDRGLLFSKGTIVDGSFIEAPSSTKNADKKRDPEMHSAKKGSNRHFGMKMHIGVDKVTGIIHTVVTTPANVHDVTKVDELRRPDDREVIGDSGYLGMEKRESADPEHVTYTAAKRYSQPKKLSAERIANEKVLSSIRCKVEHAFHRIKVQFGYKKVRYRGLAKNTARLTMLASIANMFIGNCFEIRNKVSFV